MAGRRPKPTAVKLAAGNPGHRKISKREPQSPTGMPLPPAHLTPGAAAAWMPVATMLDRMGVLQQADALALERLCETYAEVMALQADVAANGRTQVVLTKWGEPFERARPHVAMLADADRRFKSWLVEFGLSPAARSKVQISESDAKARDEDDFFADP